VLFPAQRQPVYSHSQPPRKINGEFICPSTMELDGATGRRRCDGKRCRRCRRLRDPFSVQVDQYITKLRSFQFPHTPPATTRKPRAESIPEPSWMTLVNRLWSISVQRASGSSRGAQLRRSKAAVGSATAAQPRSRGLRALAQFACAGSAAAMFSAGGSIGRGARLGFAGAGQLRFRHCALPRS